MAALGHLREVGLHVVAQVVEAELVVGRVGDVGLVGGALLGLGLLGDDHAGGEAEHPEDLAHPLGVAAGEVVVDGDDVDALAGQRVERGREGRDQGLALAGLHLGDVALVEEDAAHELHVEGAQAERPARGLAHQGEGLGQQGVEVLAGPGALAQLEGLGLEPVVVERLRPGLAGVDRLDERPRGLDLAVVRGAEEAARQRAQAHDPSSLLVSRRRGPRPGAEGPGS